LQAFGSADVGSGSKPEMSGLSSKAGSDTQAPELIAQGCEPLTPWSRGDPRVFRVPDSGHACRLVAAANRHDVLTIGGDVSFVGLSNSLSNEKSSNGHSKSRVRNCLKACLSRQHIFLERLQKRELHRNLPRNL
jgi:hypothetical protein